MPLSPRRISPASPEKKYKRNKTRRNEQGQKGQFTRCHFRADILQVYKFWTQMILAGNQSKQIKEEQGLHIYLERKIWRSPAIEFPNEICVILHDRQRHWCLK